MAYKTPFEDPAIERVREILELLADDPGQVNGILSDLTLEFFRADSHWRDTFQSLMALPAHEEHLKILALREYFKYLLKVPTALVQEPSTETDTDPANWRSRCMPGNYQAQVDGAFTVPDSGFTRLPHQKSVAVKPQHNHSLEIWLSHHHFHFSADSAPLFVDSHGRSYLLREGRNYLGRGPFNDADLNHEYSDVSRHHLILDICDGYLASITDLSSRGTFVPFGSCMEYI